MKLDWDELSTKAIKFGKFVLLVLFLIELVVLQIMAMGHLFGVR